MTDLQHAQTVADEERWLEEQLPEHKRQGYAEKMQELADMRRDEAKENGQ